MRLRRNLIISQVATVAVLLCILIFSILVFFKTTLPLIETGLETKTRSCAETVAAMADVGIAADDRATLMNALRICSHSGNTPDPDFKSAAVVDPNGNVIAAIGDVTKRPPVDLASGDTVTRRLPDAYRAGARVAIEGTVLGAVWAEYNTGRVKEARDSFVFSHGVGLVAILITCILSILFAFNLVRPLREMISFVHKVARGNIGARLSVKASDELGELAHDLNQMAGELQHRHDVEEAVHQTSRALLSTDRADRDLAIELLAKAVQVSWACSLYFQESGQTVVVSTLWCSPDKRKELEDSFQEVQASDFTWSMEKLLRGESIVVADTNLMPSDASAESEKFKTRGIRSILSVPIRSLSGIVKGVMVFCSVGECRDWPQADVRAVEVVAEMQGVCWDRDKAEAETKESEERFRMLFELAPDAYYLNDMQGNFVDGNRAAEEITGYKREELVGSNMLELNMLPEEELPRAAECLYRNFQGMPTQIDDITTIRKDGSRVVLDIRAYPVEIGGQKLALGTARDVTERVRAETKRKEMERRVRQLQKMEAVGRLAGGVAHEINNPLGVILGFSQAICKRIGDDDSLSMPLRSIEREALRCKNLVADLLAFSRKSSEDPSPVDVCKIIESTLVLITNQARLNSIEVISECAVNLPEILADFNGLQQVLVNLSTNAIDAMQAGGTLRYEARNSDSSLTIRVTDTGTGMSSEVRERIFEPFFTTKEVGKGTGLGLSLVYEIVKQYGGSIECRSEIGRGSTFTLTFPLHRVP